MPLGRFEQIVSLGRACQPAHQIRRLFGVERAHVFDWVITPDEGLRTSIEMGLKHFFLRDRLIVGPENCIVDAMTDVRFLHEFPEARLDEHSYAEHAARFSTLVARWRELMRSNRRVLFVRQHAWNPDPRLSALKLRDALDVAAPALDYTLLYLTEQDAPPWNESRIVNMRLRQTEPYDWRGDDQAWSALFDSLGVSLAET